MTNTPDYPTAQYPQYPPQPGWGPPAAPQHTPPNKTPWWRRTWVIAAAAFLVGAGIAGAAAGSSGSKTVAGPTVHTTATVTTQVTATTTPTHVIATHTKTVQVTYTPAPPPPPKSFGNGTYVVGTDIQPGTYHADGGSTYCAWVRLSSLDGSDSSIIALGNSSGGPLTVQIQPSDKGFEVQGDCTFHRIG